MKVSDYQSYSFLPQQLQEYHSKVILVPFRGLMEKSDWETGEKIIAVAKDFPLRGQDCAHVSLEENKQL